MRILVVSAHYPPNFVSGGTLQPQRLARGLRELGHDVSVYAGWLGDRPPLVAWHESDETGMPIRWISTGAFIGWSDIRNFDNPAVRDDFARELARRRPDVVHLHALQSLGSSLVTAAKESGARVVVTMHDFWWFCARQFLVDRTMRPCSLVVSCGDCECEVDRPWLGRRTDLLATRLRDVDLVLAPGHSAAAVLLANGVDPDRLKVDENGVVDTSQPGKQVPSDGLVRFAYAGGEQPMKGFDIMLGALPLIEHLGGWRIELFGISNDGAALPAGLRHAPVRLSPAFSPGDLTDVLRRTDVLVIPSVMRETFSLLTREALNAGVPVVTSDSIGPEEVVEDGVNGLVVRSGDAVSLAHALARLVTEPGLLGRLRSGAADTRLGTRTISEQVQTLDATYRDLVGARPTPTTTRIGRVAFLVGIGGAPRRYRAVVPGEALRTLGIDSTIHHYRDRAGREAALRADVVIFYRVPATLQIIELLTKLAERGIPALFDVDDLIFDPELATEIPALRIIPETDRALWLQGVRRYRTTMERCVGFIGSTPALIRHASAVTGLASEVFPNGVGMALGRASNQAMRSPRRPGPVRVGYFSGTNTHDEDWSMVEQPVLEALASSASAELWLGGHLPETEALARARVSVRRLPYMDWLQLPRALRDLDVNLAPLDASSRFNQAKSAIKWLEAALVGTPTIASPTEPFADAIESGRTGLLADSSVEWHDAVRRLLDDARTREDIGRQASREALTRYSPDRQAHRYVAILQRAFDWMETSRVRPTTWIDEALDEPWLDGPVEPPDPAGEGAAYRSTTRDPRRRRLGLRRG